MCWRHRRPRDAEERQMRKSTESHGNILNKPAETQHELENNLLLGDCRTILLTLPPQSVQCVVTSPPYFGALRDYGVGGIGHEDTLEEYLANLVTVFHEVRRVLKDAGVLWVNLGETWRHKRMLGVPYRV